MTSRTNPSITSSSGISLNKIPTLKSRNNYAKWAREIRYPLITANAWEFTSGKRKTPEPPSYQYNMPKRPAELIRRRKQKYDKELTKYRREANDADAEHPDGVYITISLTTAKQELEYLKNDLKNWETAKKLENERINIVHATISVPCKQELGRTEELRLKKV
jgi:hypothetical protein